jgi:hypothetical protein
MQRSGTLKGVIWRRSEIYSLENLAWSRSVQVRTECKHLELAYHFLKRMLRRSARLPATFKFAFAA